MNPPPVRNLQLMARAYAANVSAVELAAYFQVGKTYPRLVALRLGYTRNQLTLEESGWLERPMGLTEPDPVVRRLRSGLQLSVAKSKG